MANINFFTYIITFLSYMAAQVLLVRNLVLFDKAFCYIYLAALLLIPFEASTIALMLTGFFTGVVMDIFYDTLGMHTAACVLIMYIRPWWSKINTPRGGYEGVAAPSVKGISIEWFFMFALPLILIHHLTLFFIEAGGLHMIFFTLTKVVASTIFTFVTLLITQYLFHTSGRTL